MRFYEEICRSVDTCLADVSMDCKERLRELCVARMLAEALREKNMHREEEILVGCIALLRASDNPQQILAALSVYCDQESNARKNQACQSG